MSYPQRSWNDGDVEVVPGRLWAGGVATALVAAGIAFVGVLIINSIFEVGIQTAGRSGALVDNASTVIPVAAAIAALASTALLHLLLMTTPRPASFFSAIAVLVIIVLILQVFLAEGSISAHIATGVLYAAIGIAIVSMLSGVSATSVRPAQRGGWGGRSYEPQQPPYDGRYDHNYGTYEPQPPYPPQGQHGGPQDRTQRYDPRDQRGQWR
ncbi:hypothetical protein [Actinomycetospora sp. NBRC 106378]|uniref:hypothetical protein n=1 Tax=Actinomycetospora sp. NBRC 106378 TaxID=3032208 RepID=UPI0024A19D53|nr:hypothetical protein [Actinomycetospora sp. NBRC 106378]GLZ56172.1 hypothetical protein Acsp07_57890 [Actinomycetospora sp. NBRC 106378]